VSYEIELATVDRLECVVEEHEWDFERNRRAQIDAHWTKVVRARPSLYDGRVFLARRIEKTRRADGERVLGVGFFETRYSRFLAWREFGFPDPGVRNCFAMAALRSADGAFLLAEMGPHTANAGSIYFPCGTPDPLDAKPDGSVDLEASIARELFEETGVAADETRLGEDWTVVSAGPRIACIKILSSAEPAASIEDRVERFLAAEKNPELARAHMIFHRAQLLNPRIPDFVRAFLQTLLTL
jgi:8-oxo-dGTP pyrophosphatase MutT (NUDIX family)